MPIHQGFGRDVVTNENRLIQIIQCGKDTPLSNGLVETPLNSDTIDIPEKREYFFRIPTSRDCQRSHRNHNLRTSMDTSASCRNRPPPLHHHFRKKPYPMDENPIPGADLKTLSFMACEVNLLTLTPAGLVRGPKAMLPIGTVVIVDSRCLIPVGGVTYRIAYPSLIVIASCSNPSLINLAAETAQPVDVTVPAPPEE